MNRGSNCTPWGGRNETSGLTYYVDYLEHSSVVSTAGAFCRDVRRRMPGDAGCTLRGFARTEDLVPKRAWEVRARQDLVGVAPRQDAQGQRVRGASSGVCSAGGHRAGTLTFSDGWRPGVVV